MEIPNGVKNNLPEDKPPIPAASEDRFKTPHSKIFKFSIVLLAELILLIGAFSLGMNVGFRKAGFTYSWSQNYPNNFGGRPALTAPPPSSAFFNPHGLDGTILNSDKNTLVLKDEDSTEKTVLISSQTSIRMNFQNLKAADLKAGEEVVVIGEPNPQGQIEAKLIRVLNQ
jgi:RNase P/RNase MRP subunit p29